MCVMCVVLCSYCVVCMFFRGCMRACVGDLFCFSVYMFIVCMLSLCALLCVTLCVSLVFCIVASLAVCLYYCVRFVMSVCVI